MGTDGALMNRVLEFVVANSGKYTPEQVAEKLGITDNQLRSARSNIGKYKPGGKVVVLQTGTLRVIAALGKTLSVDDAVGVEEVGLYNQAYRLIQEKPGKIKGYKDLAKVLGVPAQKAQSAIATINRLSRRGYLIDGAPMLTVKHDPKNDNYILVDPPPAEEAETQPSALTAQSNLRYANVVSVIGSKGRTKVALPKIGANFAVYRGPIFLAPSTFFTFTSDDVDVVRITWSPDGKTELTEPIFVPEGWVITFSPLK